MIMTKKSVRLESEQKIRNKSFYLTDNGNYRVKLLQICCYTEQGPPLV